MKVALIHDHLAQDGGAEKVLQVLAGMFPAASIYTLLSEQKQVDKYFPGRRIETSIIQKLPGGVKHYQWYLAFMPMAVEFFDLRGYDLVISDSSSFAKGVITRPDCLHIDYCHTPTRYLWSDTHQYINELKYNRWFKKIISMVLNRIRIWDRAAAQRPDIMIANSETIKQRIFKYYRREAIVIYPPVEVDKFKVAAVENKHTSDIVSELALENRSNADSKFGSGLDDGFRSEPENKASGASDSLTKKYFLAGCRLAPYKRIDLVVEAFKQLGLEYKLKVFGDGVDLKRLKKIAAVATNIEFLGRVSEEEKIVLFQSAQAFINPQEEDFGITAVESMAAGRPVVAYRKGGATETIVEGKTGIFFDAQTPVALAEAIKNFRPADFDSREIRQQAEKFSVENFKNRLRELINSKLGK